MEERWDVLTSCLLFFWRAYEGLTVLYYLSPLIFFIQFLGQPTIGTY